MAAKSLQRGEAKVGLFAESSKKGVKFVLESEKSILLAKGGFRIFFIHSRYFFHLCNS